MIGLWFVEDKAVVALSCRVIFLCNSLAIGTMIYSCCDGRLEM